MLRTLLSQLLPNAKMDSRIASETGKLKQSGNKLSEAIQDFNRENK